MDLKMEMVAAFVAAFSIAASAGAARAQSAVGCSLTPTSATRQVLHCRDGIDITAERGARFGLVDRDGNGTVDAVSLKEKAVLIEVDSRRVDLGFKVITPQAIAAVRGTRWTVDVKRGVTSVFVLRGRVSVRGTNNAGAAVTLSRGQGVDVDEGSKRLVVKRWPPARVAALLRRLER